MGRAIDETTSRRKLQETYNKKHGITPQTIQKAIGDSRMAGSKLAVEEATGLHSDADPEKMNAEELKFYLAELEDQMDLAAKNLEFEAAARFRDKIEEIKKVKKLQGKK